MEAVCASTTMSNSQAPQLDVATNRRFGASSALHRHRLPPSFPTAAPLGLERGHRAFPPLLLRLSNGGLKYAVFHPGAGPCSSARYDTDTRSHMLNYMGSRLDGQTLEGYRIEIDGRKL